MQNLVVLTGAGISAESGLKTFRDSGGLWEGYNVYEVANPNGWAKNPKLVLDFYNMRRKDAIAAKPNAAHFGLVELEEDFNVQIITQNVDDLHERAGSKNVLHLHGELLKMRSEKDVYHQDIKDIKGDIQLGDIAPDGGQYRPHIVWFEEDVPMLEYAIDMVQKADIFVVIGTSLQVYPAAGLISFTPKESSLFIIDKQIPTISNKYKITAIESSASDGVAQLSTMLRNQFKP
jgi:NAD-dependent deacetylase